jgi:hypothetical protein
MKNNISLFLFTILIPVLAVRSQEANHFFPERELVTTGIYYYPEHWKENHSSDNYTMNIPGTSKILMGEKH